ncbi:MAG: RidA family protein [Spirochaeta sp.]|jgi:2-iminobutanoate/2-iminopropanoate deaminase|nr:RidA family protein [Spirochaeta sp.]
MERYTIQTDAAPAAVGPYSQAVVLDRIVYTSGQLPMDPETGALVPASIEVQTRRVLDNVQAVLEASGSDLNHVLKITCFISDMENFAAMNAVYAEYFPAEPPARSCVQVARLPKDAMVEIEAVAMRVEP